MGEHYLINYSIHLPKTFIIMAGKPIATIGSMHVCPMCSGIVPHVGGPVTGPGMPGVTINGQPIAVMGDMCTCAGPPDMIAQGCPGVTINGKPIATVGSMTAHGGQIVQGIPGATISPSKPTPNKTMPLKEIPFPKITIKDRVGAAMKGKSKYLKEAKKNQEQIKKEAEEQEKEPLIYNLQWLKNTNETTKSKAEQKLTLSASVKGINDGSKITFTIFKESEDPKADDTELDKITASVKDNIVTADWDVNEALFESESKESGSSKEKLLSKLYFTADHDQ
jgi:uncharacterized Zn-binding protein involved in type VI secretion